MDSDDQVSQGSHGIAYRLRTTRRTGNDERGITTGWSSVYSFPHGLATGLPAMLYQNHWEEEWSRYDSETKSTTKIAEGVVSSVRGKDVSFKWEAVAVKPSTATDWCEGKPDDTMCYVNIKGDDIERLEKYNLEIPEAAQDLLTSLQRSCCLTLSGIDMKSHGIIEVNLTKLSGESFTIDCDPSTKIAAVIEKSRLLAGIDEGIRIRVSDAGGKLLNLNESMDLVDALEALGQ